MTDTALKTTTIAPVNLNVTAPAVIKKTVTTERVNTSASGQSSTVQNAPTKPTETHTNNQDNVEADSTVSDKKEFSGDTSQQESQPDSEKTPQSRSQLDRLSKVERRVKEREARIEAQSRELAEKEAKIKEAEEWLSLPEKAKKDPIKAFEKLGIEFDDLVQAILNGGQPPEEKVQQNKVTELEKKLTAFEEQQAELRRQAQAETERQAAVMYVKEGHEFVRQNAEEFELIASRGSSAWDDAWQLAEETYKATGEVPDIKEVCKVLENYYEEELVTAAQRAMKSNKLAKKLGLNVPDGSEAEVQASPTNVTVTSKPTAIAPTLGGKMSQAVPGPIKPGEKLSDKEKLARIVAWGNAQIAAGKK